MPIPRAISPDSLADRQRRGPFQVPQESNDGRLLECFERLHSSDPAAWTAVEFVDWKSWCSSGCGAGDSGNTGSWKIGRTVLVGTNGPCIQGTVVLMVASVAVVVLSRIGGPNVRVSVRHGVFRRQAALSRPCESGREGTEDSRFARRRGGDGRRVSESQRRRRGGRVRTRAARCEGRERRLLNTGSRSSERDARRTCALELCLVTVFSV